MRVILALAVVLASCDGSESSSNNLGSSSVSTDSWRKIDSPYYATNSGLFRINDPEAGNTVYLHIGKKESSMCALPGASGPAGYKEIKCPYYSTNSGLFSLIDPDNGNRIYLHIGAEESSIYVLSPAQKIAK